MFPTKHLVIASAGASEIFCQTSAAAVSYSTRRARVGIIVVLLQVLDFFVEGCKDVIEADHGGDVLVIVHLSGQHVHQERERERFIRNSSNASVSCYDVLCSIMV